MFGSPSDNRGAVLDYSHSTKVLNIGTDIAAGKVIFKTAAGTTNMTLDASGNLGINQASPSHKLDVSGTGRFTGTLTTADINTTGLITATGNISGSSTSTGSFGRVEANDSFLGGKFEKLRLRFFEKGYISPSGIKDYLECPLRFYYKYISNIRETYPISADILKPDFGKISHKVLEDIYSEIIKEKGISQITR